MITLIHPSANGLFSRMDLYVFTNREFVFKIVSASFLRHFIILCLSVFRDLQECLKQQFVALREFVLHQIHAFQRIYILLLSIELVRWPDILGELSSSKLDEDNF